MTVGAGHRDVAIVGMSCLFPGGDDVSTFWSGILAGRSAITTMPDDRWPGWPPAGLDLPVSKIARRGGFVRTPILFDAARHRVMPTTVRDGDMDQFVLLELVARALEDAGIGRDDGRRERTDLVVARGGYVSGVMCEAYMRADGLPRIAAFLHEANAAGDDGPGLATSANLRAGVARTGPSPDVDRLATCIPNLAASRAANRLDLGGAAFVVDAACASALIAVELATDRLRSGRCDVAVAAAVNFTQVPVFWHIFDQLGALSQSGEVRPFDRRADGLLLAEGAGVVVLERAEDAGRRARPIHALVRGAASSSDGGACGVLAPSPAGEIRALERAWQDAGEDPATVGLVEAHGTATVAGDAAEIEALRAVFGHRVGPVPTRALGSVKSMIGHAMPAAGMAALVKATLALSQAVLPPSLGCEQPRADLDGSSFYVNDRARPWIQSPGRPRRAGVNAFGFGGVNAHVVLEEVPRPTTSRSVAVGGAAAHATPSDLVPRPLRVSVPRPTELLAFAGKNRAALASAIRRAARFVREDRSGVALADLALALAREADPSQPARLAMTCATLDGLAPTLEGLATDLDVGDGPAITADVVHVDGPPAAGLVAALFPGIGFPGLVGEFPGHVLETCLHFPVAREVLDTVEERDRHPADAVPTSLLLVPPPHLAEGVAARLRQRLAPPTLSATAGTPTPGERNLAHVGMLVSEWSGWRVLEDLGVQVDGACGQSLGDIAAAWAGGMTSFDRDVQLLWRTLSEPDLFATDGLLAAIVTSEQALAPRLDELGLSIAIHLSPELLIVGGEEHRVREACALLRSEGVLAHALPFPPVHTPLWDGVRSRLMASLGDDVRYMTPRIPVYSAVEEAPLPHAHEDIQRAMYGNLTRPVRFWQTLSRMGVDGFRVFVQVGIGTLATNARTVQGVPDATFLTLDSAGVHPLTQIQRTCGALFVRGAPVRLERLFEHVTTRPVSLDVPRPEQPRAAGVALTLYRPLLHAPVDEARTLADDAGRERARGPVPAPVRGRGGLPFVGRVLRHVPGREIVLETRLELREDLYLADHVFLNARSIKPLAECLPVVPLAMTLEMLAEAAACLVPGLGVVALEAVRARRWIAFEDEDALDVRLEASLDGPSPSGPDAVVRVRARALVGESVAAEAVVELSRRYRGTLRLAFTEPSSVRPFPAPIEQLYADRHLFHGPAFRCIAAITEAWQSGLSGVMVVPERSRLFASLPVPQLLLDPVIIDAVGQMVGLNFLETFPTVLPVSIERLELLRPAPPPGTRVSVRVEIDPRASVTRLATARIEVGDGSGGAWMRVAGWQDRLFDWSAELTEWMRVPESALVARRLDVPGLRRGEVVTLVAAAALHDVDPSWVARFALTRDELRAFDELATVPARQRDWLQGRIAAKEAVRLFVAKREGVATFLHPASFALGSDDAGRPIVLSMPGGVVAPRISIAHSQGAAVAIAADSDVGIDVEPDDAGAALRIEDFATAAEIRVAASQGDGAATALWCAKEAAAKALGAGLDGRPRRFEAVEWSDGKPCVVAAHDAGRAFDVRFVSGGPDGRLLVAVAVRR